MPPSMKKQNKKTFKGTKLSLLFEFDNMCFLKFDNVMRSI